MACWGIEPTILDICSQSGACDLSATACLHFRVLNVKDCVVQSGVEMGPDPTRAYF